jgi:colanic acid biosynthesis glycosyl transferase WcaI
MQVHRVWHPLGPLGRTALRVGEALTKAFLGSLRGLTLGRPDVILTVGAPIIGALVWSVPKRVHGSRLVNVVYDLYPEISIESGKLKNPVLIRAASYSAALHWRCADINVVLSDGFRRILLEKGVDTDRIAVVPVWIDTKEIQPMDRENSWRIEQGIDSGKTVILYAGTIGVISGATVAVEAAEMLRERSDILFLFVGDGAEKARAEKRCSKLQLPNVRFLPFQPRSRLCEVQATADIGLVTLAPGLGRTSLPSKVLGYMAAGRPVIASVEEDSDTARTIEDGRFGIVVPPADPGALARAVTALAEDAPRRLEMGEHARRMVVQRHDADGVMEQYVDLLTDLANGRM